MQSVFKLAGMYLVVAFLGSCSNKKNINPMELNDYRSQ